VGVGEGRGGRGKEIQESLTLILVGQASEVKLD